MFGPAKTNGLFGGIVSSIVKHFEFVANLLHLFLIPMRLENVHRPFQVRPCICHLHRYVDCS
jgi:hypothetical protein